MLRRQLQNILNNSKAKWCLKVCSWLLMITAIFVANVLMKGQEISFVYNNF